MELGRCGLQNMTKESLEKQKKNMRLIKLKNALEQWDKQFRKFVAFGKRMPKKRNLNGYILKNPNCKESVTRLTSNANMVTAVLSGMTGCLIWRLSYARKTNIVFYNIFI
jgi:hypothetical protein